MKIALVDKHELGVFRVERADGSVHWVPDDPGNRHRQEIAAWVAAGGKIEGEVARKPRNSSRRKAAR